MKAIIFILLILLVSCGSYKKAIDATVDQTTEKSSSQNERTDINITSSTSSILSAASVVHKQSNDSSESNIVIETIWYDTSKSNDKGISPVSRKQTITSQKRHGRQEQNESNNKSNAENQVTLTTTINDINDKEERSKSQYNSEVHKKQSGKTSVHIYKQFSVIIIAIVLYYLYRKYRKPP